MFKSSVAWVLNKYLGKYVQDLDTENLNVGIFNGEVQLHDLKLKPEALYELKLPIEVREGLIGTVSLNIPWNGLLNQPIVLSIEDVFIVAGAVVGDIFDAELEKRLIRARKRRIIDQLEEASFFRSDSASEGLFERLATNLARNMQIYIRNIHIRYEDTTSIPDSPVSCGICLQSLSIETTNSKWKPSATTTTSSSIYQLLRVQSLSIYWNSFTHPNGLVLTSGNWRQSMHSGLQSFSINGEDFEFILKPVSAKAKLIITRSNEAKVPKLLLDVVLHDAVVQISRSQYTSMVALQEAFHRIDRNREYREFHPGVNLHKNANLWWKYAFNAVLEQRVRPYSWSRIKKHREIYRQYYSAYEMALLKPADAELKIDLQKLEDQLQIIDLVIAREQAKIELSKREADRLRVVNSERWWLGLWKCVEPEMKYELVSEAKQGFWSRLTHQEKEKLCELIDYPDGQGNGKPKQYIEHKYNLTLANLSVSLMSRGQEIVLASVTQFLVSLETRPEASAFKFSARAENFLLEGLSSENELIPLIQADSLHSADSSVSNVFSFDFEKNPMAQEADFSITMQLEQLEVVYNEHTFSELIGFFHTIRMTEMPEESVEELIEKTKAMGAHFLSQKKRVFLNLVIKGPTIVLPEHGSIQRGGNIMILDTGCLKVNTDLQSGPISIEEETKTELEEHLYDRLAFELTGVQLMFCDCSDEWREKRETADSELHLFTATKALLTISNSVKHEYKQLPRHKMNLSVSSTNLNLSNRRVGSLLDFVDSFPLPTPISIHSSHYGSTPDHLNAFFSADLVPPPAPLAMLRLVRSNVVLSHLGRLAANSDSAAGKVLDQLGVSVAEMDRILSSSDQSDEEMEVWARTMDQPGFEDNVSPSNSINVLLRLVLGELVINFSRSENKVDVPYLMLRLERICVDSAILQYGPAIQLSLGSFQLVDKVHTCAGGCYIELVSGASSAGSEMLSILYRKVKANCPDFKTHFHSVEHSLVFDLQSLNALFHREALAAHCKYFGLINKKISKHDSAFGSMLSCSMVSIRDSITTMSTLSLSSYFAFEEDPPVPPGATKLSYSVKFGDLKLRLCNTDFDFLDFKISGFETDCMIRANERTVHRLFLNSIHLEDLSDMTLYSKILYLDGDHFLDAKYVLHSPRISAKSGIDSAKDTINTDGHLKLHLGRLNVVYLHRFTMDVLNFLEPFFDMKVIAEKATAYVAERLSKMKHFAVKLQLALDIAIPTLLVPQKSDSTNLLILNLGKLRVENFFKWDDLLSSTSSVAIDNVLAKLDNVQISRAIMTLTGTIAAQELILEPTALKFDMKRRAHLKTKKGSRGGAAPMFQVSGSSESIVINLGQKDLATILLTYQENLAEGMFAELHPKSAPMSPVEFGDARGLFINQQTDDTPIRKLQTFLCLYQKDEAELEFSYLVESFQLTLFMDLDEVLSSPVRDMQHALCRIDLAEISSCIMANGCGDYTIKSGLQHCLIKDIVKSYNLLEQKVYGDKHKLMREANKQQPFMECTVLKSAKGSWSNDLVVESYTMNLSIPFLANLANFLMEALPVEKSFDGGIINYGYIGDLTCNKVLQSASHQYGINGGERINMTMQLRPAEINLMSESASGCVLCLESEVTIDYSYEPDGAESCDLTISRVQVTFHEEEEPSQVVLQSCDLELSKRLQDVSEGIKINVSVSPVNFNITSKTARVLCGLADDFSNTAHAKEPSKFSRMPPNFQELENLWTPKKIPVCVPCVEEVGSFKMHCGPDTRTSESMFLSVSRIRVLLQMEGIHRTNPLLQISSSITAEIQDWTSQMQILAQLQWQASYFNESLRKWEPLIEPVNDGSVLRPWELSIQLFHAKAFSLSAESNDSSDSKPKGKRPRAKRAQEIDTEEGNMAFVEKQCVEFNGPISIPHIRKRNSSSESEVENTDQYLNKLSELIGHLVCDDNESESDDNSKDYLSDDMHLSDETEERPVTTMSSQETRESVATYVMVCAQKRLEISLTSAAIKTINTFLSSFLGDSQLVQLASQFASELEIHNYIGCSSTVTLSGRLSKDQSEEGDYVVLSKADYDTCESGRSSPELLEVPDATFDREAAASAAVLTPTYKDDTAGCWYHRITSTKLCIEVEGFDQLNVLVPQRSASSIHPLHPSKHDTIYHVVVNVEHKLGSKVISVQSPLSVRNDTAHALSLYYRKSAFADLGEKLIGETVNPFEDLVKLTVVAPNETYSIPLFVAYHSKLFIHPSYIDSCKVSETSLWWQDFPSQPRQDMYCVPKNESGEVVFSVCANAQVQDKKSANNSLPYYMVTLLSPVTIHNYLPLSVEIFLPATNRQLRIETGSSADIYELGASSNKKIEVKITSYFGASWVGELLFNSKTKEKTFQMNSEAASQRFSINTKIQSKDNCNLYLYTSHWVVNKCGMQLLLKGNDSKEMYQLNDEEPVLVNLGRKQDVQFKICDSSWSKPFSLNSAGTSGVIFCHDYERGNKIYQILASITFSQLCPTLTKIVTLVPYFMVMNNSRKNIRFMEDNEKADLWIDLAPTKCVPFWPETKTMRMFVRFRDGKVTSQNFPINYSHTTVLKMDKGCGLTVKVTGGAETPFTVVFSNFGPGEAPIRIDNLCELVHIKVHQLNTSQSAIVLNPYQSILYTWDDPCKERTLLWNANTAKSKDMTLEIWKDSFGVQKVVVVCELPLSTPPSVVQTSSSSMSSKITAGLRRFSKPSFDAASRLIEDMTESNEIYIYWVSFLESGQRVLLLTTDADTALRTKSMVDPEKGSFELSLCMTGVGISLATDPDHPTQELAYVSAQESAPNWEVLVSRGWCPMPFELAAWCEEKYTQKLASAKLKTLMQVDFDKMQLIKPFYAELRRVQTPAIWMQYRRSPRQVYLQWKLHHLQVDNQLPGAENPAMLSPLPNLKGAQQPCLQVQALYQYYNCQTVYKYLRVLLGSFKVDVDKRFFSRVLTSFQQGIGFNSLESKARADVTFAHQPYGLKPHQVLDHSCLIENLFISPLTIQIQYTPQPSTFDFVAIEQNKLTAFFDSLNDIQDVHLFSLRLQPCEIYGLSIPSAELVNNIYKHYSTQAHQQFYASVLGLNVLANPYQLITDLAIVEGESKGPHVGAIELFSEGIAFGAKTMMGYVVGGSSGHFVPGGDAFDCLTPFTRKEMLNRAELNVSAPQELLKYESSISSLHLGMNGLFYDSEESTSLEIFCKGTGCRYMDMIEAGDIDVPLTTTEYALRRLIDFGELSMPTRIRMPKYTNAYMGLRPYSGYEAIGFSLVCTLKKDIDLQVETYWAHAPLNIDSTSVILITTRNICFVKKTQIWGSWKTEKEIMIADLVSVPKIMNKSLIFSTVTGLDNNYSVEAEDALVAEWLQNKIETAMIAAMEEKPCPTAV